MCRRLLSLFLLSTFMSCSHGDDVAKPTDVEKGRTFARANFEMGAKPDFKTRRSKLPDTGRFSFRTGEGGGLLCNARVKIAFQNTSMLTAERKMFQSFDTDEYREYKNKPDDGYELELNISSNIYRARKDGAIILATTVKKSELFGDYVPVKGKYDIASKELPMANQHGIALSLPADMVRAFTKPNMKMVITEIIDPNKRFLGCGPFSKDEELNIKKPSAE